MHLKWNSASGWQKSIPVILKLVVTLRFLAVGAFQRAIGKDTDIALGRSSTSAILTEMFGVLEKVLCPKCIKMQMNPNELLKLKEHNYNNYSIPGVIGCIDGTNVKLLKPNNNYYLFFSRKGCFSINVLINFYLQLFAGMWLSHGNKSSWFDFEKPNRRNEMRDMSFRFRCHFCTKMISGTCLIYIYTEVIR